MDLDFELVIYILFVTIAILSRVLKKRKQQAPPAQEPREEQTEKDTITFEDLLREFTEGRSETRQTQPRPEPAWEAPVERLEELEFRDKIPDDEEVNQVYEEAIREAEGSSHPASS